MTARSEGAGHGPRGAAARHHPHGAQRRDCTRRSLRHPVLPFDARHVRCQRRAARHPRLAGLGAGASSPAVSAFLVPHTGSDRARRDEQRGGDRCPPDDPLPARPPAHRGDRAGHRPGGPLAGDYPRRPQRRPRAGQSVRDPLLPHGRRRTSSGDLLLGTRNVSSLGAGASSTSVIAFLVPSTVAAGAYRVVAVAAALGQQTELNEANATASGVVTVSP
jgi:hypothetical protein